MRVCVIKADPQDVEFKEVEKVDLEYIKSVVNGHIEYVPVDGDSHLYCDEEGKLKSTTKPNWVATALVQYHREFPDIIMGDVIVLGDGEEGEEGSIPRDTEHAVYVVCMQRGLEAKGKQDG